MKALDFDDVLLIPYNSEMTSRDEVDLSIELSSFLTLNFPIIASPMKGISSFDLVQQLSMLGGIGILHRFYPDYSEYLHDLEDCYSMVDNFGVSVGIDTPEKDIKLGLDSGAKILCLDVANGYLKNTLERTKTLRNFIDKNNYQCLLMSGNVVTEQGFKFLLGSGADLVRVGIGSGNLCTTRINTGVGIPQLQAIRDCNSFDSIIADGGIRNSGDIIKALAFGARAVMVGSLFARTYESSHNGIIYGMASRRLQEEYYHSVKSVEGIEQEAEKNISTEDLISEICWNLKSACTYLGVTSVDELAHTSSLRMAGNRLFVEV